MRVWWSGFGPQYTPDGSGQGQVVHGAGGTQPGHCPVIWFLPSGGQSMPMNEALQGVCSTKRSYFL
jgi:hypothetical protein